ncbi:hypothetical protein [Streptomyces sp. NRRL S-350]|uniref:hypothetical protein n=1 Tax=Streptomyces sp. NRRL S-350 TaxID=1463902 RepID=UPI00131D0A97|nr:hypothetical protein [Streptomyces sp. NRRL S-350]
MTCAITPRTRPVQPTDVGRGWTRANSRRDTGHYGSESTTKSARIGCPFHDAAAWWEPPDHHRAECADTTCSTRRLDRPLAD